jgi:serine/threonine-protein kinase RsbW
MASSAIAFVQASHRIDPADFMAVRSGLQNLFAQEPLCSLCDDTRGTAEIVMAEALNNIVEHAYASQTGSIDIWVGLGATGLECSISDYGRPMPDFQLPNARPQELAQIEDLPEGGFGWFLIRSLAQDLQYQRRYNQNLLRFRVPFNAQAA